MPKQAVIVFDNHRSRYGLWCESQELVHATEPEKLFEWGSEHNYDVLAPEPTAANATDIRRDLVAKGVPAEDLDAVVNSGGQVWDTDQLREDFEVLGFSAPFVVVVRRSDRVKGSLEFTHRPRFYFNFEPVS